MNSSKKARSAGGKPHTSEHQSPAFVSQITPHGQRVVVTHGRTVQVEDRNRDSGFKRHRLAKPRFMAALERFGPDAVVYEYVLTFPAHLDVLNHEDAAQMWATIEALAPDAFLKLEDSRSASPFPVKPHAHFISTVLLPEMPGLWRCPDPLEVEDMQPSTASYRTLFGWFCYTAKPTLGGAARPTREDYGRFSREELAHQELTAQDRTDAARRRAQQRGFKALPDTAGWITGGKKRRKRVA